MTYSIKSPLTKTSGHYGADQLWAAFEPMTPPDQYANAQRVLKALVPLCVTFNLDEVVLAAREALRPYEKKPFTYDPDAPLKLA